MYEFHGWMSVWTYDAVSGPFDDFGKSMPEAMQAIRSHVAAGEFELAGDWLEIRETTNGQVVVVAHGLRNHRRDYALRLFTWIAARYPHSYGILYASDLEDVKRENEFVVYRFARGEASEIRDSVLSPIVPSLRDRPTWEGWQDGGG